MRLSRMRLWFSLALSAVVLLAACQGSATEEAPSDPLALLTEAANNIRAAETFRLDVSQTGVEYAINVLWEGDDTQPVQVAFRRAEAQYVAPDQLQGSVRVIFQLLTVDIDIYSLGELQWVRFPLLNWFQAPFAYGFNPRTLIAEDTGFQAALAAVRELVYLGIETLEDGTSAYHLSGTADGPAVTSLLVNLIEETGAVGVDIFIDRERRYPVRLMITQPDVLEDAGAQTRTWTVDVFDVDAPSGLLPPEEALALMSRNTPESTAEVTPVMAPGN